MRRMKPGSIAAVVMIPFMILFGSAGLVPAEDKPATISVTGVGVAQRMPNMLEIEARVKGEAELAEDAVVKFREAKRRAHETITALKIEGLAIRNEGFEIRNSVNDQMGQVVVFGGGGGNQNLDPRFLVTETMRLTLTGVDKLDPEDLLESVVKILDTAKDAGLQLGGPPPNPYQPQVRGAKAGNLARFKLTDVEGLRESAYEKAMSDARKSAERIAGLSGAKLGPVASVRLLPAQELKRAQPTFTVWGVVTAGDDLQETLTSPSLAPIPVKVELAVVFELAK